MRTTCIHESTHIEQKDTVNGRSTYPVFVCDYCESVVDEYDGEDS